MFVFGVLAAMSLATTVGQGPQIRSGPVWRVMPAVSHGNLAIFPVVYSEPLKVTMSGGYITLDEGLKAGTIEVTEKGQGSSIIRSRGGGQAQSGQRQTSQSANRQISNQTLQQQSGGAQVNELWLTNKSGKKLVLLAGEMVVGGQQDRIVQKDMIIPPSEKPVAMNVFCVEQGRWSGQAKFGSFAGGGGGAVADPTVRGAAQGKGQQEVWAKVADKNSKSGTLSSSAPARLSATTYQNTLHAAKNEAALSKYQSAFAKGWPKSGAIGAVVSVNGHLIWLDVFMDASLFSRYWPKLLKSYIVEAATEDLGSKVVVRHPSLGAAQGYLNRISGTDSFEGKEGVYKLVVVDGKGARTYELFDIANSGNLLVHFNKMQEK